MTHPVSPMAQPQYSERIDDALALVTDAFRDKVRKGSGIPYLTHLLQVMVYVAEHGGDEDQMVAALLHDYLEDVRGASADDVESRFGARVRRMVEALSDSTGHPKPPWEERKQAYVAALRDEPAEIKLISAADKLHNAQSIVRDFHAVGEAVFDRFTASREQTLWYYREVTLALADGFSHPLVDRLRREVDALHRVADSAD